MGRCGNRDFTSGRDVRLEVAREPLHFPIAVARGVESAAAMHFVGRVGLRLRTARLGFRQRPLRRGRELAPGGLFSFGAHSRRRWAVSHTRFASARRLVWPRPLTFHVQPDASLP